MITEKDTIRCEAVFNEEHTHRFLWKRVWNKDKPLAAVVMLNPCQADNIVTDTTTSLVVNNIARLEEFGGIVVVNLFSLLTSKLNFRWNSDEDLNDAENDSYIKKAAEECSHVILAWGKSADTNKRIADRARKVLELLKPYSEKLYCISDGERDNLHPLTPSLRNQWILKSFDLTAYEKVDEPSEPKTKSKATTKIKESKQRGPIAEATDTKSGEDEKV